MLLFTLAMSVLTGLFSDRFPAFSRRSEVAPDAAGRRAGEPVGSGCAERLIVAQIGASFMLLIAAGLMLRSLLNVERADPGIQTQNLLAFRADMSFDRLPLSLPRGQRLQRIGAYWHRFAERLAQLPGIVEVGGGGTFPLNENDPLSGGLVRERHPLPREPSRRTSTCGSPRRIIFGRSGSGWCPDGCSRPPIRRRLPASR